MKRFLVLAKNQRYFLNHIQDRFSKEEIKRHQAYKVILNNGDEYIYLSSKRNLRGYHNVKVLMWSVPEWFDFEVEQLIKLAEQP